MMRRPPWAVFRAALEERGFRPSRRLGQNFLLDENMARAIVRDARIEPGAFVLEVGAGCGFLSMHLSEAGAKLLCVEIDARLLEIARALLSTCPGVRFIHGDALAGKHRLAPEIEAELPRETRWHLVCNLPYSISGPLLAVLASHDRAPATMTVLVQKEVAERIAARPGTPAWGPLSIRLQARYSPRILRSVSPALFWPRPMVESALVRLERAEQAAETPDAGELEALDALVGDLFRSRRQSLGRVLAGPCGGRAEALAVLAALRIPPETRAEALGIAELRELSRAVTRLSPSRQGEIRLEESPPGC